MVTRRRDREGGLGVKRFSVFVLTSSFKGWRRFEITVSGQQTEQQETNGIETCHLDT